MVNITVVSGVIGRITLEYFVRRTSRNSTFGEEFSGIITWRNVFTFFKQDKRIARREFTECPTLSPEVSP